MIELVPVAREQKPVLGELLAIRRRSPGADMAARIVR